MTTRRRSEREQQKRSKRYLQTRDLADRYGVNKKTIERMWIDGRLPPPTLRSARTLLWDEELVEQHEREHLVATGRRYR
jgi:hypothetical protein